MLDVINALILSPPVAASKKPAAQAASISSQMEAPNSFDMVLKRSFERKSDEMKFEKKRSYKEEDVSRSEEKNEPSENLAATNPEVARRTSEPEVVKQEISQFTEAITIEGDVNTNKPEKLTNQVNFPATTKVSFDETLNALETPGNVVAVAPTAFTRLNETQATGEVVDPALPQAVDNLDVPGSQAVRPVTMLSSPVTDQTAPDEALTVTTATIADNSLKTQKSEESINLGTGKSDRGQHNFEPLPIKIDETVATQPNTTKSNSEKEIGFGLSGKSKYDSSVGENSATNKSADGTTSAANLNAVAHTVQIQEPVRLAEAQKSQIVTQVTAQVDTMLKTNNSTIRLQLYPEELGHIDVKLVSTKDGIGLSLSADKATTSQALNAEMNTLRQSLEQAGITITSMNIANDQTENSQQNYQDRHDFSNQSRGYKDPSESQTEHNKHNLRTISLRSTEIDYRV